MSRFWPHGSYDEDQPLAHTILWVHVLTRAETSGAGFGAIAAASIYGLRNFNMIKGPTGSREFQRLLLKSTGNGTAVCALCDLTLIVLLEMGTYRKKAFWG
jgi:hypothetical protein